MRRLIGFGSLGALALSLNALVWAARPFSTLVMIPLALAVAGGAVWLGMTAAAGARSFGGRTAGGVNAVVSSVIFLGLCIVVYAFIGFWDVSWDLTREGRRQLSPQTVQVLQSMTKEVRVACFFINNQDELILVARDKTMRFLEQCRKYTDLLKVELLDPQVEKPRIDAMGVVASPQGTVVISAGTRKQVIRFSGASPRLEERDFTNALINVLRDAEPKIGFLTGHGERRLEDKESPEGAGMLGQMLALDGYRVEPIAIKISDPEVPQDCGVVVINNVTGDLHPAEVDALKAYLDRGGRLLLFLDPWIRVQVGRGEQLRPWLESKFGIKIGDNIVVSPQAGHPYDVELSSDHRPFEKTEAGFMEYRGSYYIEHAITRGFEQTMLLPACRTVEVLEKPAAGVAAIGLLRTAPEYWAETDVAKLAETGVCKQDEGEAAGPLMVAVAAVARAAGDEEGRPRDMRLVVVGDSDCASNGGLNIPGNLNFVLNAVAWLNEQEELIAIRPTGKEDPPLFLSPVQQRGVAWVSILLTVQAVVLAGLAVYMVRRKNQ